MDTRRFALIWGILFLVIFAAGVIPGLLQPPAEMDPDLAMNQMYGRALSLFPVNLLHDGVHLLFGIWGILAYRSYDAAKSYARITAVIYAVFMVMGLIPTLDTTFGLVPLFSHDVWLHAILAAGAAYFGFVHKESGAAARDS
jgi:hypothetical protein